MILDSSVSVAPSQPTDEPTHSDGHQAETAFSLDLDDGGKNPTSEDAVAPETSGDFVEQDILHHAHGQLFTSKHGKISNNWESGNSVFDPKGSHLSAQNAVEDLLPAIANAAPKSGTGADASPAEITRRGSVVQGGNGEFLPGARRSTADSPMRGGKLSGETLDLPVKSETEQQFRQSGNPAGNPVDKSATAAQLAQPEIPRSQAKTTILGDPKKALWKTRICREIQYLKMPESR